MEIFPIQRGYDGAQFIVTKAGYTVSIPGLGVASDATQVAAYRDEQNNIWYIDRHGAPVKLTNEQIQWGAAQINQQAQVRATATGQQPIAQSAPAQSAPAQSVTSTTVIQQAPPQSTSGGSNPLLTGLAAAGGAMAGTALSNSLYHNNSGGIPYGVPVYHGGGKYYYHGANGNKVYVNNSNNKTINQWNKQTNWQNIQHNSKGQQLPTGRPSGAHANFPTQLPAHSGVNNVRNAASGQGINRFAATARTTHGAARASGGHMGNISRGGGRRR